MATGSTPGDLLAAALVDEATSTLLGGSVGVRSVTRTGPTSLEVELSQQLDANGLAVLVAIDSAPGSEQVACATPTANPLVWSISWAAAGGGGGGVPGGPVDAVQYNAGAGTFGGSSACTWDGVDFDLAAPGTGNFQAKGQVTVESTTNNTIVAAGSDVELDSAGNLVANIGKSLVVNASAGNALDVLTSQGPGLPPVWAAQAGGGIGGSIASYEVAVGTGPNTIGGSPTLVFSSGALQASSGGPLRGELSAAGPQAYDAGSLNSASLRVLSGVPTLAAANIFGAPQTLDVVSGELRVNGAPGVAGQVLTSNGPAVAPTWQTPSGAAPTVNIALNTSHNNPTPVDAGAFYWPGGAFSACNALVTSTVATIAQVDILPAGSLVPSMTLAEPFPATGARLLFSVALPVLAAGWYVVTIQENSGGGSVTVLGLYGAA